MRSRQQATSARRIRPRWLVIATCLMVVCACRPQSSATEVADLPASEPKILVTVYLSPTPDDAQLQATRAAASPTPTLVPMTPTQMATPYVGIFLGAAEDAGDSPEQILPSPIPRETSTPSETTFAACPMAPDERFGTLWLTNAEATAALGCPADIAVPYAGTTQVFEHGVMYFTPDGAIWAIAPGSPTGQFWYAAHAPDVPDVGILPPDGLRVPTLGFGQFWRTVPGVKDTLGFARTDESSVTFAVQPFQNGALLEDAGAGQTFILGAPGANGPAYGPY